MGALKTFAIVVLLISLVTFVALFGRLPALRKGPIGVLHRLLWKKLPSFLRAVDGRLMGGRATPFIRRSGHYLLNENHPLILIFFLTILLGSQILFIPAAFSHLSAFHRISVLVLSVLPYFFTYRCVTSTSSTITHENHWQQMRYYPYDHVLFQPGQICRSCHFLKPARSKHCSICKVCVAKHDHHCVWVMNCLGKDNYAYFVGMLLSLSTLLPYGAYLAYAIMTGMLQSEHIRRSDGMSSRKHWSAGRSWSLYFDAWAWALAQDFRIGGVGMLALLTGPLAWGMLLYHLYLIWAGMTTNESDKWSYWKEDIDDGLVYKLDGAALDADSSHTNHVIEPIVDWPITSSQRLAKCQKGQQPEDQNGFAGESIQTDATNPAGQQHYWRQLHGIYEVDNLYDLGFWDNMADVLSLQPFGS